jgi:hypothetical protein
LSRIGEFYFSIYYKRLGHFSKLTTSSQVLQADTGDEHVNEVSSKLDARADVLAPLLLEGHNHRRWMPYDAYLASGLPVGTGVVELARGSVVKHRMEGEGKRWSLAVAEAMLTLRSLKKSHDHDLRECWRFRARQRIEVHNQSVKVLKNATTA